MNMDYNLEPIASKYVTFVLNPLTLHVVKGSLRPGANVKSKSNLIRRTFL